MSKYIKPEYGAKKFTCPYCGAITGVKWINEYVGTDQWGGFCTSYDGNGIEVTNEMGLSMCEACGQIHVWFNNKMINPENNNVVMPVADMPKSVKDIFEEARIVYSKSSKAAAALLRLALQKLCKELGCKGKDINEDIADMVKNGLSTKVQKAFDIIRVTGNEAVHPGTIDFNDNDNIALKLFDMLNFIVEKMITEPKEIDNLYLCLPENKLKQIEKRDNKQENS